MDCDFSHTMDSSDNKNAVVDTVCLCVQVDYRPSKFSPSADVDWSVVWYSFAVKNERQVHGPARILVRVTFLRRQIVE